jgi:hypothetical protein
MGLSPLRISPEAALEQCAKDFMLCEVVRRAKHFRADGRPPGRSNDVAWRRH